jgi:5-(carboxyamino)imidazole ribonucleotide synthase
VAKSIGVVGGGQLARMMIAPAQAMGIAIKVLAEAEDCPAQLAATQVGDYKDLATVREFAKTVDVITFDHEHVPLHVLETLEAEGFKVQPSSQALRFAQS